MITYEAALTTDSWTEILGGKTSIYFDILSKDPVGINFQENGEPALDAPTNVVFPSRGGWDFHSSGFATGQKIYAKALKGPAELVVVR